MPDRRQLLIATGCAIALTLLFWMPLWQGGGLVGGDIYPYYFSQKTFLAEQLHNGILPLWDSRIGFGHPLLAESQTAPLYPVNPVLYGLLDVNTAYNVSQLSHYVLAFVFTWLYARRIGLAQSTALFTALVFVYGWFPSRICLEWAIIGGVYLPLTLWLSESWLQTSRRRYLIWLAIAIGLHLLAGHYCLAFINQLTLAIYVPCRLWYTTDDLDGASLPNRQRFLFPVVAAIGIGFLLAAVQLVPTWELKQNSQRDEIGEAFSPTYGHIPPAYWSQVAASWWWWYSPEIDTDRAISELSFGSVDGSTNKVEAHLYFGLIPLALAIAALFSGRVSGRPLPKLFRLWMWLAIGFLLYTSGWGLVVTRYLPGFSFFMGPGRYGIVTTLGIALLAGYSLESICSKTSRSRAIALCISVAVLTTWDLHAVSRLVTYAVLVDRAPVDNIAQSPIGKELDTTPQARVVGPGQNVLTMTGASQIPVYLGIGPSEYVELNKALQQETATSEEQWPDEKLNWLREIGTTHILAFEPIERDDVELTLATADPFLHRVWGRSPSDPLFLYRIIDAPGRVGIGPKTRSETTADIHITEYQPHAVKIEARLTEPEEIILRDLYWPGWSVQVNGAAANSRRTEAGFRAVQVPAGDSIIEWTYRPTSVWIGFAISTLGAVSLLLLMKFTQSAGEGS